MKASGKKRHYCEIQTPTKTSDSQGGYTTSWAKSGNEWFDARPLSMSRTLEAGGLSYKMAVEFVGFKRSDLTLTPAQRIVWNSENYTIHSVVPDELLNEIRVLAYV